MTVNFQSLKEDSTWRTLRLLKHFQQFQEYVFLLISSLVCLVSYKYASYSYLVSNSAELKQFGGPFSSWRCWVIFILCFRHIVCLL